MSTTALNGVLHVLEGNPDSPVIPDSPSSGSAFPAQQTASRNYVNTIRGQSSPFPSTPTSSHMTGLNESPPGISYAEFIKQWNDSHVARWLTDIKCGSHAATFKSNDIRGDVLLELDQATLQEMGVSSIGDRLRILNAVKRLRQRSLAKSETSDSTNASRISTRRLETARPAPLMLPQNSSRNDLPRVAREAPDSARTVVTPSQYTRPLPQPSSQSTANTPGAAYSSSSRTTLPPLPPIPRGQPLPPPPVRSNARSALSNSNLSGRRTPTQLDAVPSYTTQALPPAPTGLLTPSSNNWYGLPADPRPGNTGGGKTPQSTARSTSPLPPSRPTPHGRNGSGSLGLNSPVTSSPGKVNQRTGNGHPYAIAQASVLQFPPTNRAAVDLSPISESYPNSAGTASPPNQYGSRGQQYNPGTPSHNNAPSWDDLRRKLVKFYLPDEGLTFTIDVDTCVAGVEIIEKVLKKFGKGGAKNAEGENVMNSAQIEDGGLSVDGWGVFMDESPNNPLNETQLISICHAPPNHPSREKPLMLRRIAKARGIPSPSRSKFDPTPKHKKRASAVSILSGLGVYNPEQTLESTSPSSSLRASPIMSAQSSPQQDSKRSKRRNFLGQRPPSELISTHMTEFFPNAEKKVLQRAARQSMMMRTNTLSFSKRDSSASWIPPLPSRFSSSTSGTKNSDPSPTRTSFSSSVTPTFDNERYSNTTAFEDIPRVSISTDDGRSVDLSSSESIESRTVAPQLLPPIPFPSESFSESLESLTNGNRTSRPVSRTLSSASGASRRLSYMTELRSKRDRSDTASLLTVDEITAEVENRRASRKSSLDKRSEDEWTKVGSDGEEGSTTEDTLEENYDEPEEEEREEEGDEGEDYEEEEEEEIEEDDSTAINEDVDPVGTGTVRKATKWIKGALIGAGSFGKVYLGMDASSGFLMAVKQVELPTGAGANQERKQSMLSALEREIELLQDLQHDNIVQYLYSSLEDDCLNIFLEYVPGGSVTALLRSYGAFEEPLVKNFVRQILQGLCYLHDRGIIHRDIKGANILVDNRGGVKISDFGISKKVDVQALAGHRNHRHSLQGSVFWMSPEVVKQSGHTYKADIWSVGCLVVEMFTGEHPYPSLSQMQAIFKIGSSAKPSIPPDITPESEDFLRRTFELDQLERPSAAELLQHSWLQVSPTKAS